jgi:Cyclic nucleotide-binding domain/Pyridine nucleotide-disulphide oxidoreductase
MTEEMYCRDQDVYIVGAGNSAGQAAMYLSRFARCVKLLARGDSVAKSMSQYLIDELARTPNVAVQLQTRVVEAHGENHLESITIANDQTGQTTTAPAVALFIFIGATPHTTCVADLIECDARGYILSGADLTLNGRSSAQLAARTQALFARNKRTGHLRRRRCAPWLNQARCLRCGGRLNCHRVDPPISRSGVTTNTAATLDSLRRLPLFAHLTDNDSAYVEEGQTLRFAAGEIIVREGEPAEHFFVVLEGNVSASKNFGEQEAVITEHHPGGFFGEIPMLLNTPYFITARARCVTIISTSQNSILEFNKHLPISSDPDCSLGGSAAAYASGFLAAP